MKEIKFRAWYKPDSIMVTVNSINFDNETISVFQLSDMDFADIILMQYTGLKDKNGKEIYEGDVVELMDAHFTDCKIYEIQFVDGAFCGKHLEKTGKDWEKIGKYTYLDILLINYKLEVIGNIFENQELLEQER